jgi:glycosyltransferase involved in cell wall biosynthesis
VQGQRWIVVADSPFLPATGGGEQEHLGFVRAAAQEDLLALLVLPGGDTVELSEYNRLVPGVPILATPRRTSPLLLAHPNRPYVVASRPPPPWLVERARAAAPDATAIVVFSYKSQWIGQVLAEGLNLPAVLRQHNREGAYHRSLASQTPPPRRWVLRWEAMRIERDEHRLNHADWLVGTADISLDDARWRAGTGAPNVVHVPPFALARDGAQPPGAVRDPDDDPRTAVTGGTAVTGPPRVLFLGTLDTATNVGALDWFLTGVWPRVLAGHTDVVLDVVGRGPSPALRRRLADTERVELAADVPDPTPYLNRASVAVNPVVSGSGVNIKVVEYLDAGIPVVSTSVATRGLPLRPGVDLEVEDEGADFADAVLRLLAQPGVARAMADEGRRHLGELLDVRTNLNRIAELLSPRRPASRRRPTGSPT